MTTQALTVLTVSPEPAILRRLYRLLTAHGYAVVANREMSWRLSCGQFVSPHFLIVDRDALDADFQPLLGVREQQPAPYPYVLLLRDEHATPEIVEALEAGVDDFLEKPGNPAETLARLQAGACYLASRRGADDLLQIDRDTGLMTRSAWVRLLQRQSGPDTAPGCCVLMELEDFGRVQATIGWPAARDVLRAVADRMRNHCRPGDVPAKWYGCRFSTMLPDTSIDLAQRWAETLRTAIAGAQFGPELDGLSLTASVGVAAWHPGIDAPAHLLETTEAALSSAIESGGNCTVSADDLESDDGDRSDLPRDPFFAAKAGDVMVPSVLYLESSETVGAAAAIFNLSHLGVVPVVDRHGQLEGVLRAEDLAANSETGQEAQMPVRMVMTEDVVRVQDKTPLADVRKQISESQIALAVVVQGAEPIGIITRAHLDELMQPVGHES